MKFNIKKVVLYALLITISLLVIVGIYEFNTVNNEYYINEKNLQIPIFTYHHLVKSESEIEDECMQTTIDKFKEQILGLMKLGYKPITYENLKEYSEGKTAISKWSFIITFDDGYSDFYDYVYPISKEYNIPITVFIIDDCMGKVGYLTWNQVKEMNEDGLISVYSHGLEHIEYNKETPEKLVSDINIAYANLENNLNNENMLKVFAYPYGLASEEHINEMAKAGYIENLMDNRINLSNNLNLKSLHRCYPCNDSVLKIVLKQLYRAFKYK